MSVIYVWQLARKFVVLLVLGGSLGAGAAAVYVERVDDYTATASVLIRPTSEADLRLYASTPERFVRSQARIAASDAVLDEARAELPADALLRRPDIGVSGGDTDDVIEVSVQGSSPSQAAQAAEAVAESLAQQTTAATSLLAIDGDPNRPSLTTSVPLGALLGLVAALGVLLVYGAAQGPVFDPRQLREDFPGEVFPLTLRRSGGRRETDPDYLFLIGFIESESKTRHVVVQAVGDRRLERRVLSRLTRAAETAGSSLGLQSFLERGARVSASVTESTPGAIESGLQPSQVCTLVCVSAGTARRRVEEAAAVDIGSAGRRIVALEGR